MVLQFPADIPQMHVTAEDLRHQIIALAKDYSVETTPRECAITDSYRGWLSPGTRVNIACISGSDYDSVIRTAAQLRVEGFDPVPHIPARGFATVDDLRRALQRLREQANVTDVLVIAGDYAHPLGPFADTMTLLESGLLESSGILRIGVAGHPEGNPDICDFALRASLSAKRDFATRHGIEIHLATQFCLDAGPIVSWERSVRSSGNDLPIDVGLAGATTLKSLLKYARLCGVNASGRALTRDSRKLVRLGAISYPDRIIAAVASHMMSDPACRFRRLHFYPFGGLKRTARWLAAVAEGKFTLRKNESGFVVSS